VLLSTSKLMMMNNNNNNNNSYEEEQSLSSLLASSNFSISNYLNLALSSSTTKTTSNHSDDDDDDDADYILMEQRMASLALQLQMTTQSCHDEIGRIGAELQAIVPRCAADVSRVRSGLDGMELDVRSLLEGMMSYDGDDDDNARTEKLKLHRHRHHQGNDITTEGISGNNNIHGPDSAAGGGGAKNNNDNTNKDTAAATSDNYDDDDNDDIDDEDNTSDPNPLSTLHSLLNLKNHLITTRSILAAASSWDETINSIPKLLSNNNNTTTGHHHHHQSPNNLIEAVAALSQLEQGARALQCMPEGQMERTAAITKLRTQLEILLKPQLLHALKKMDTRLGPLQQCVSMYGTLGKMDVMREEYVKMRPGEVIALWFSFGGGGSGHGGKMSSSSSNRMDEKVMEGEDHDIDNDEEQHKEEEEEAEDFDFSEETNESSTTTTKTTTTTTRINSKQFIEFLPTFYDAVLELLSKERTQSKQVFGPELAPSIVGRVLLECFKPIISSFKSRLGNVCPVPPGKSGGVGGGGVVGGGNDGFGGTEGIAAAYESTIQFLSLAYDQMEPWEGQNSSNNDDTGNKDDPLETIRTAFRLIASPFVPYQRALAEAERDPLGKAASMVAKDVRSVVGLQDAADRLGDLAPFMFPLADCKYARGVLPCVFVFVCSSVSILITLCICYKHLQPLFLDLNCSRVDIMLPPHFH